MLPNFVRNPTTVCSRQGSSAQSHIWQLHLAPVKCQVLSIAGHRKKRNNHEYSINGETLQQVDRVRDLRIMMDPSLKFASHIDTITHKAAAVSWTIMASLSSRDQEVLKLAFCTYVGSILEYCSPVWNPHHKYLIDRVEKIQKRFTKSIPSVAKYPYMERLRHLKLMTLERRRLLADLTFCFKLLNGFADSPLRHLLLVQDYPGTRGHSFKLRCSKFSTDVAKYSFYNRIVKPWNALPNEVVNSNTISRFNAKFIICDFVYNSFLTYT